MWGNIKKRDNVKITKAWDPTPARAQRWGGEVGATVVEDVSEIFKDKQISAVIITSETNRHQDLVKAAAKAKKHMFVEKPLGMGAKDSFAMAKAIEKAGVKFSTGYFSRGSGRPELSQGTGGQGNLRHHHPYPRQQLPLRRPGRLVQEPPGQHLRGMALDGRPRSRRRRRLRRPRHPQRWTS